MRISILLIFLSCYLLAVPAFCFGQQKNIPAANDLFKPFLKSKGGNVVELTVEQDSVLVRRTKFSSKNGINKIYCITASPISRGRYPAILFFHGGSSHADELKRLLRSYAARGYVAMAIDLPGICNPDKATLSEGPWRNRAKEPDSRFDIAQGIQNSSLTDAVTASLEAFNILTGMSNVDDRRVGLTGFSWGGYMTTMVSGLLGNRLSAAYSVFGSGFYDRGSKWKDLLAAMPEQRRSDWIENFDARRKASNIKCPYFIEESINDEYFWPDAVMATLDAVEAEKGLTWGPNLDHKRLDAGEHMQALYFDYYLKRKGAPFGKINIERTTDNSDESRDVFVKVAIPKSITATRVLLYYADKNTLRALKTWKPIIAVKLSDDHYKITIPSVIIKSNINYYVCITDSRQVSTSTYLQ
ncbi:alpha/beta hydrolase family protein [Flavitalea sp.]|nr:alpha/beta fold hydrolase [Flavitalea sp.]